MRVALLVNPRARRARDPDLIDRLQHAADRRGVAATVITTSAPDLLPDVLRAQRQAGVDVLAVCGGDGTLMTLLAAAAQAYDVLPPLLLLPGGTMNTVARNLGIRGQPQQVWSRALALLSNCRDAARLPLCRADILRVDVHDQRPLIGTEPDMHAPATQRTHYGFILGAAMGARYLAAYDSRPDRGLGWAAWLALRTIGSSLIPGGGPFARWLFGATPAQLCIDGDQQHIDALRLLLCATVPDVGLGFRVPWQAGSVSGRFHLIASGIPITRNALQVPRILRGLPLRGAPHIDRLAGRAQIRFERAQQITLDGEVFAASALDLSLGPPLPVILPP